MPNSPSRAALYAKLVLMIDVPLTGSGQASFSAPPQSSRARKAWGSFLSLPQPIQHIAVMQLPKAHGGRGGGASPNDQRRLEMIGRIAHAARFDLRD